MNKKKEIHKKLDVMKECYKQRSLANLNLIYSTFTEKVFDDMRR